MHRHWCSNPHPVRKLGAIHLNAALRCISDVPILTQSENWALFTSGAILANLVFQSSPSPKTGRYIMVMTIKRSRGCSNPHPVRKLGAMRKLYMVNFSLALVFQSSPSPKTGRYFDFLAKGGALQGVPILTQSENWALS